MIRPLEICLILPESVMRKAWLLTPVGNGTIFAGLGRSQRASMIQREPPLSGTR